MADDIICKCLDCVYYHSANGLEKTNSNMMCHFALENGYPRLIPPIDCYKKEGTGYISRKDKNKKRKMDEMKKGALADMEIKKTRRQYDQTTKDAAVKAVLIDGEKAVDVAERYGITTGLLYKWIAVYKEKQAEFENFATEVEAEFSSVNDKELPEFEVIFPASELVEVTEDTGSTEDIEPVECCESSKNVNENVYIFYDRKQIKAAAFDEIADITDSYPDRNARELIFYINGIIGLAERLCEGEDNG